MLRIGQALLRTYGRFFAEFLEKHSPVRLGLLDLITCVGLRYGVFLYNVEAFLGRVLHTILLGEPQSFRIAGECSTEVARASGFTRKPALRNERKSNNARCVLPVVTP